MRNYTVHHRQTETRDIVRDVEGLVFVKEGFCWPGLFFPALWALARGLWLVLLGYLVVATAVLVAAGLAGLDEGATFVLGLLVNLVMGFEGNDMRRWTLERRGYRTIGLVSGSRAGDAERRFLDRLVDGSYKPPGTSAAPRRSAPPPRPGTWANPDTEDDVVGLFPKPENAR